MKTILNKTDWLTNAKKSLGMLQQALDNAVNDSMENGSGILGTNEMVGVTDIADVVISTDSDRVDDAYEEYLDWMAEYVYSANEITDDFKDNEEMKEYYFPYETKIQEIIDNLK